jgi:hypothetical protein
MCTNPLRGSDNLLVDMWLAIGYFDLRFSSSGDSGSGTKVHVSFFSSASISSFIACVHFGLDKAS